MLLIFVLFLECIFPSTTICVHYRESYEVAFYERLSTMIFRGFFYSFNVVVNGGPPW